RSSDAVEMLASEDVVAAEGAALDEAGEEIAGAPPPPDRRRLPRIGAGVPPHRELPLLDALPQRLVDDAQLRHRLLDPGALGIEPRAALAGVGVLAVAQAVPDEPAGIARGVEDAGAAAGVAVGGGRAPGAAERAAAARVPD